MAAVVPLLLYTLLLFLSFLFLACLLPLCRERSPESSAAPSEPPSALASALLLCMSRRDILSSVKSHEKTRRALRLYTEKESKKSYMPSPPLRKPCQELLRLLVMALSSDCSHADADEGRLREGKDEDEDEDEEEWEADGECRRERPARPRILIASRRKSMVKWSQISVTLRILSDVSRCPELEEVLAAASPFWSSR